MLADANFEAKKDWNFTALAPHSTARSINSFAIVILPLWLTPISAITKTSDDESNNLKLQVIFLMKVNVMRTIDWEDSPVVLRRWNPLTGLSDEDS